VLMIGHALSAIITEYMICKRILCQHESVVHVQAKLFYGFGVTFIRSQHGLSVILC